MVRVEVPAKVYGRAMKAWPRSAWAWSEVVPGRKFRVHYPHYEVVRALEAEEILARLREVLAK
jgi:hypothetical protein